MAIEQGSQFALASAVSIQFALLGVTTYAIVYGWLAPRCRWMICQACAVTAYFAISSLTVRMPGGIWVATGMVAMLVIVGLATMARSPRVVRLPPAPWWDNWLRAAVTVIIVLASTALADRLGPNISAILATYPAISSVVTPFIHMRAGADVARAVARGIVLSHISFATLFVIVATMLPAFGIVTSYALAAIVAAVTSLAVAVVDQEIGRRMRREEAAGHS